MSTQQKTFLKWFGIIATGIIIPMILMTVSVLGSVDVIQEKVNQNAKEILETREYHQKDIDNVMFYMRDMRIDQKEMKGDIKELLKK